MTRDPAATPTGGPGRDARAPAAREPPSPMRFVVRLLLRQRTALVTALLWSAAFVLVPMQVPLLTGYLVSGVTGQGATFFGLVPVADPTTVLTVAVVGLVLSAGAYAVAAYANTASVSELSRRTVATLRKALVHRLDTASGEVHERFGSGELLNRVLVDTQATREFVETVFFTTVQNVLRVAYPVVVLFLISPTIALVAAAFLPVQYLLTRHLQHRLRSATRVARATQGRLTASVKENLDGIEAIQTSNAEGPAIRKLWAESDQLATDQVAAKVYGGLLSGSTWGLTSLGLALAWGIGGNAVLHGAMTLGALVAATGYVVLLYTPMQRFTSVANIYQKGVVAFERIQEVLETPSAIVDDPKAPALRVDEGRVTLRDVSFAYSGHNVLENVSLEVPPRSLTILVGRNGSGKSTLLKLLTRLHDPTSGTVAIDGQDLRTVRLASLRARVALVPQRPTIFSGTLAENLRLGRPGATDLELVAALREAGALDLLRQLPNGLATALGPGHRSLSGGEAQRVAIARALVREPSVLLLDEPNSALDHESESALVGTLAALKGRRTVIVIAHHAGALLGAADRIVVLDGGAVSEAPLPRPGRTRPRPAPTHAIVRPGAGPS